MEKIVIRVEKSNNKVRLDKLVAESSGLSRSKVKRDILLGAVTVNGEEESPDYRVRVGDIIEYIPSPPEEVEIRPEEIPLDIIYRDEDIIVINKPAGLVVHPGAGNLSGTLVNALLYWFHDWDINGYIRPGIVHRLDKDTSGVMVVARNEKAQKRLIEQFKNRRVKKKYIAIVVGNIPEKGEIDLPIGRDRYNRLKFSPNTSSPREALTLWRVVERWGMIAMVEVTPRTGRTHQIRVHLSHLGYPLVGDPLYGSPRLVKRVVADERIRRIISDFPRHALHAAELEFEHPSTGKKMKFTVELPEDLSALIHSLREVYDSTKS